MALHEGSLRRVGRLGTKVLLRELDGSSYGAHESTGGPAGPVGLYLEVGATT
jgi:hypothetical protein